jgi:uncharacterized protein (UPF0147 family)
VQKEIKHLRRRFKHNQLRDFESEIRRDTIKRVIRMLEETSKDETLSQNQRDIYSEIVRRLKDFARAY